MYLKEKLSIHVNRETLKDLTTHMDLNEAIYTMEEQLFYNKVCRTLIFYYLRAIAGLKILSSGRVRLTNKLDHLNAHRSLIRFMEGEEDDDN